MTNERRTSTPEFLDQLDADQLYRCQELLQQRIKAKNDEGRVTVWQVSDSMINYLSTQDYFAAIDALPRIAREQFGKTGQMEEMQVSILRVRLSELQDHLT